MTQNDFVKFWQHGSEEAWKTVEALMKSKRYLHALFFCHLSLEKALKSKYAEHCKKFPPPLHNLVWLAQQSNMQLSQEEFDALEFISTFNISGRYEDYKISLHKKANTSYTKKWVKRTEELLRTIQKQ